MTEESKTPETEDTPVADESVATAEETAMDEASPEAADTPADDDAAEAEAEATEAVDADDEGAEPGAEDTDEAAAEPTETAADDAEPEAAADEPGDEAPSDDVEDEPAEETPQYDYGMLHDMNVHQLQEIAKDIDHEAVHGYTTMHKEHLIHALCLAFGLEEHVHHEVVGIDKVAYKAKIAALKVQRDAALEAGDKKQLKRVRRRIHQLKHRIRKATV